MDSASKKAINNAGFIATLAPLIEGPEASALATAAGAYRDILKWLGIRPNLDGFDGCKQGALLAIWCREPAKGDEAVGRADLMNEWTAQIWFAIDDLASGKLPA